MKIETAIFAGSFRTAVKKTGGIRPWKYSVSIFILTFVFLTACGGEVGSGNDGVKAVTADLIGVSGGHNHSTALRKSGIPWTWGLNGDGQLGDGVTTWFAWGELFNVQTDSGSNKNCESCSDPI